MSMIFPECSSCLPVLMGDLMPLSCMVLKLVFLACILSPEDACGCAAYQFASVGIAPCALNTSAAVGTSISITFTVFDYGAPALASSVSRTLLIVPPCPAGQFYCSGTCLQISCAASAALAAAAVTPVITLTSTAAGVFGGTNGGSTQLAYGTTPGFSLMPCSSYGGWFLTSCMGFWAVCRSCLEPSVWLSTVSQACSVCGA